jgi:hypothetical protein
LIELHTMVQAWGLPTFTPFGLKLIAYMRMADIRFSIVVEHDPRRAPTKNFPWRIALRQDPDCSTGPTHCLGPDLAAEGATSLHDFSTCCRYLDQ